MSRSEVGCKPVHTTCELVPTSGKFWPFLTIQRLCVYVWIYTNHKEKEITIFRYPPCYVFGGYLSKSRVPKHFIQYVFIAKARVFCIFVVIRGEDQSLEAPNSPVVYTTGETVLDKFTGCEVVFKAGKNAALYSFERGAGSFHQFRGI